MIQDPKTSRETLNKYPKGEARMVAQKFASIMGVIALMLVDETGIGQTIKHTLEHPGDCTRGNCTGCESVSQRVFGGSD